MLKGFSWRQGRYKACTPASRSSIRLKDYWNWIFSTLIRWSSSRLFFYQQNSQVSSSKVLQVNALQECGNLCPWMSYLLRFKVCQAKAIFWPLIFIGSDPLLERHIDKFCIKFSLFKALGDRELKHHFCHRILSHKDDLL